MTTTKKELIELTKDQENQLFSLNVEKIIGQQKGTIIRDLQALADDYTIGEVFERAPVKNVMSVATEAGSDPEEVINFIRYQLGRSTRNQIWARTTGKKDQPVFAIKLVEQLSNFSKMADEIVEKASQGLTLTDRDARRIEVHIKLIQIYLGYLTRYHTYLKWQDEQQRQKGGGR